MNYLLELDEDEIRDSITDNYFLKITEQPSGHDRGIDALYIDDTESTATIHFFNCKYVSEFQKTKKNFPAGEIDKILSFLRSLMSQDENLRNDINPILYSKCEEIWKIFETQNPNFIIHICANHYQGFESKEEKRFEREISKYSNFQIRYHLMPDLVNLITTASRREINAKVRGIDQRYFEKTGGNLRALIFEIDAKDLIRIVLDDEVFNDEVNAEKILLAYKLFEKIESKKIEIKQKIIQNSSEFENKSYIIYASYYILHIIGELAQQKSIELVYKNLEVVWKLYPQAIKTIEKIIEQGKKNLSKQYSHTSFFRSNKPKKYFEDLDLAETLEVDEPVSY